MLSLSLSLCQVGTYQTRDELFILMEIVQGGELWT